MRFKLTKEELQAELVGEAKQFPTYVRPILVLANRFAGATKPKVVGQMTELIQQCPYNEYSEWKIWYLKRMPGAIDNATAKIVKMLKQFKGAIENTDEKMVREWVEDLVLGKTFVGLRFQEAILRRIATQLRKKYRLATPEDESRGIDGYIDNIPVSIKPATYKLEKERLREKIEAKMIYYEKTVEGIEFEVEPHELV